MTDIALLPDRAVLEIAGEDRVSFLQGLVSNDVTQAAPGRAVWAALLTPQGKWLADFFILADADRLLLDLEAGQRDTVIKLLTRYRLRAKVTLSRLDLPVSAAWNGAPDTPIQAPDPRLPEAGWRILGEVEPTTDAAAYDAHRLALGLPDGSRDLESEKSTLVESGFDELGGISWEKGCYMGQELTARTKYRGLVKRRLVAVAVAGELPPPGTPIFHNDVDVGTLRSGRGDRALASLRLDAIRADHLTCAGASLTPRPSPWLNWEKSLHATA
ncbi:MAG: folate-binding protein [Acetobacteraceae bacterium]|nr:folate-binding protein [Acetobacteraceae bacterium]